MADKKISALTSATSPLAGTEVLPIVQSGDTVKVSVANLTAGRSFDALGMTLTSTDASATAAPLLELYRDSASPAASDTLGEIEFNGEDSAGNKQAYGLIHASILSPTSTAEQGQLHFETATAGALTEKMIIGTNNLVINEIGAVFNVRIEGDTDANLFYTDATNSRIGIGTITPAAKLDIVGTVGISSTTTLSGLTASTPLALNASKEIVSVVVPAFSAYQSTAQTGIGTAVATKLTFTTEEFDTNSNFASSTFTPTVAGYYQVSGSFSINVLDVLPSAIAMIYKNGSIFKTGGVGTGSPSNFVGAAVSALIYMNGTTDTLELYAYVDMNTVAATYDTRNIQTGTYFQASLVRSA